MIKLKRAYDPTSPEDGHRFLVERLWPRGVKKTALHLDAWLKDVAPSTDLRQWFSHDPEEMGRISASLQKRIARSSGSVCANLARRSPWRRYSHLQLP